MYTTISQTEVLRHATATASELSERISELQEGKGSDPDMGTELSQLRSERSKLVEIADSLSSTEKDPDTITRLAIRLHMSGAREIYTIPLAKQLVDVQKEITLKEDENKLLEADRSNASKDDRPSYTNQIHTNDAVIRELQATLTRINQLLQLLEKDSYNPTKCLDRKCDENLPSLRIIQYHSPYCVHCESLKTSR